jgi:hypothetical protein
MPIKPDHLRPDDEEFAAWCQHPVTRFVALAHQTAAEQLKAQWTTLSWRSEPTLDPIHHATLYARADAYSAFLEASLQNYLNIIGEPVAQSRP